jgi:carbonic anhydrase
MDVAETLVARNAEFAAHRVATGLRMLPALKTIVIGCVDPRVDPELVLGVELGEVAVVRNVGGRVTPATLDELTMLRSVSQANGGDLAAGWELIVLQHTDCGITRLTEHTGMLSRYFDVPEDELAAVSVGDPHAAVVRDVEALRSETRLGAGIRVSGLVYDVLTGRVETVVGA